MESEKPPEKQYEHWEAPKTGSETGDETQQERIINSGQYLQELKVKSDNAQLERSNIFRYPKDNAVLSQEFSEAVQEGRRENVLIIGIGNLEEPLSYMAMAERAGRTQGKPISEIADLTMVDIRPAEEVAPKYGLGKIYESSTGIKLGGAFMTEQTKGQFTEKARTPEAEYEDVFVYNEISGEYEFNDQIKEFVSQNVQNPEKTHFNTPIESYTAKHPNDQYDIVACNNVLQHLGGVSQYKSPFREIGLPPESYQDYLNVVKGVVNKVKEGGTLIIHTGGSTKELSPMEENGDEVLSWIPEFNDQFEQVQKGVYRRKNFQ